MSVASDKYEKDVAKHIAKVKGMEAERPVGKTSLSDVLITKHKGRNVRTWVEVKMNHTDNLSNPRVFYENGMWQTTYTTPAAAAAVKILNESEDAKNFIKEIAEFAKINPKDLKIPTTKAGLKDPNAVPLRVMKQYFTTQALNRYIANKLNYDLGKLVTEHYTTGKEEPAHYMQAADDFYMISKANPLGLDNKIPKLSGRGDFKVRVATRSEFYEIQAEIKITNMPHSNFSIKPGSTKKNPFL